MDQSNYAVSAFEALESQAAQLQVTLQGAAQYLKKAQDDNAVIIEQAQAQACESAYISCAAVYVATFGLGCAPCFAAAIPIVEAGIIPALQD